MKCYSTRQLNTRKGIACIRRPREHCVYAALHCSRGLTVQCLYAALYLLVLFSFRERERVCVWYVVKL